MKSIMYSVYDKKTMYYNSPFIAVNQGDAMRHVMDVLTRENTFSKFPDDYELYEVGTFKDENGAVCGKAENIFICSLRTLRDAVYSTEQVQVNTKDKDSTSKN